jgi:DNA repair exonuclease SbcCD ATPase subunit
MASPSISAESIRVQEELAQKNTEIRSIQNELKVANREKQIRGSGGSLEPPGPLPMHLVYMKYSECLPTLLDPLAEWTCFSQVAKGHAESQLSQLRTKLEESKRSIEVEKQQVAQLNADVLRLTPSKKHARDAEESMESDEDRTPAKRHKRDDKLDALSREVTELKELFMQSTAGKQTDSSPRLENRPEEAVQYFPSPARVLRPVAQQPAQHAYGTVSPEAIVVGRGIADVAGDGHGIV